MSLNAPLSTVPSQLSSRSLQVSVVGASGVQVAGAPLLHCGTVTVHSPTPQVWLPGFTLVQVPAMVPVHVDRLGSWHSESHVVVTGPATVYAPHSTAVVRHEPAPLHDATLAGTSALRRQLPPD